MNEYLNTELYDFPSMNASASSFGWDFQFNAGIFLILHYIKNLDKISIESDKQDIELILKDKTTILAQAKSAINPFDSTNKKHKLIDALISLIKCADKGNTLIYISNIYQAINTRDDFSNAVVPFSETLPETQEMIKKYINEIKESIVKKQKDKKISDEYAEAIINRINLLNYDSLSFSYINKFHGNEDTKYESIQDKLIKFLCNTLKLDCFDVKVITFKVLSYWQRIVQHDSTKPPLSDSKQMTREEFLSPIIAYSLSDTLNVKTEFFDKSIDQCTKNKAEELFQSYKYNILGDFVTMNRILNDFDDYKHLSQISQSIDVDFIKNKWHDYFQNTGIVFENDDIKETFIKCIIYQILCQYLIVGKILSGVN